MWAEILFLGYQGKASELIAKEVMVSVIKSLVYSISCIAFALYIISCITTLDEHLFEITIVLLIIGGGSFIAIKWIDNQTIPAFVIWISSLAVSTILASILFKEPLLCIFLIFIPIIATTTISLLAGSILFVTVSFAMFLLWYAKIIEGLSIFYVGIISSGMLVSLIIGWAVTRVLLSTTEWAMVYAKHAIREVEEARSQRSEMQQVQDDLIYANQELARLSERLQYMFQIAEDARRVKEEFVAKVSHELRTPLNMILGFSEMIIDNADLYGGNFPTSLLSDIHAIQRNSQHLAKLVDDVLDLSALESGKVILIKENVDLNSILQEAITAVRVLYDSKGLYIKTEVSQNLPIVSCDVTRIRQVMLNLLSNAGRFTQAGGVTVQIRQEKNKVIVCVADSGPGIDSEKQKQLFEPFQQLDSSVHRKYGGTGLGLSISKSFIEMHGGIMWVESIPKEGSKFLFSLPIQTRLNGPENQKSDARSWFNPYLTYEPRMREFKAPQRNPIARYLILERGHSLTQLVKREAEGSEVISYMDIQTAVRDIEKSPPKVLIVNEASFDHTEDLAAVLSNLPYNTPAILSWVPDKRMTHEADIIGYLVKPITKIQFLNTLDAYSGRVKTILVIDDDLDTRQLFIRMLSASDKKYIILQASNGQRGLDLMRDRQPDLILLDLLMPGMNGFKVLEEKHRDPVIKNIPVIIVSSNDESRDPIFCHRVTVLKGEGLSRTELFRCIQAISTALNPSKQDSD